MSIFDAAQAYHTQCGLRFAGIFIRTWIWYLLAMALVWWIGIETIYGHPTPFYAVYFPAFSSPLTPLSAIACASIAAIFGQMAATGRVILLRPLLAGLGLSAVLFAIYAVWGPGQTGSDSATLFAGLYTDFQYHVVLVVLAAAACAGLGRFLTLNPLETWTPTTREVVWILLATFAFTGLFACAVAMLRGGSTGISQAYARSAYEYAGDIGKTSSIHALFENYLKIHPYLSMHAKVHPPGPIAILWLFSYLIGSDPLPLSIATVVFGSLSIFPLYFWAKAITDQKTALIACWLYSVVPAVVIFTATSADILFLPFTLATLAFFERAIRRPSLRYAILAGLGYGVMALLKFSLIGIGAYFGLVGLYLLRNRETRLNVVFTAGVMALGALAVLAGVYFWSGFDVIAVFQQAKHQFDLDQHHLDLVTPRLPAWVYRITNPLTWFYFAGIPVSLLFLWQLRWADAKSRPMVYTFFLTLIVLNLLYLARGEGERSALYLYPFLIVPAAHALLRCMRKSKSTSPLWATLVFLIFQTWFTESYFYTYW